MSEDGYEFYAELSDTYQAKECGAFIQEAVLSHLEGGDALMTMDELTLRLGNWIEGFKQPVKLATDSLSWDWPWIQEIFYLPGTWPENLDGKPALLLETMDYSFFAKAIEQAFQNHVPRLRRHHALDEAKSNRMGWLAWMSSKKQL